MAEGDSLKVSDIGGNSYLTEDKPGFSSRLSSGGGSMDVPLKIRGEKQYRIAGTPNDFARSVGRWSVGVFRV